MEKTAEFKIDLFGENLPSIEQIEQLRQIVNSSEDNIIAFSELLAENVGKTGQKAVLAAGIASLILGDNKQASEILKKAEDGNEKSLYLARAMRETGQFDEAIAEIKKCKDIGDDKMKLIVEKVETLRKAGKIDEAQNELKKAANYENVSAEYHYQTARLLETQGLYQAAIDNYEKALELEPEHQKALFYLAFRSDMTGDEDAAIDYYKQIAATAPVYVSALLNLSVIYEDRAQYDKAIVCVENVLVSHPNHQRAQMFWKDIQSSMTMTYDEEKELKKSRKHQILETPISDFELSVRSRNCLRKMNIRTIGDLLNISEAELLAYKNFGETSLREIKVILDLKGMHLGMALEEKQLNNSSAETTVNVEDEVLLSKPVDDLQLSVRAKACLQRLGLKSINELVQKTEAELLGVKNFGMTSLNEIKKSLANIGLSLRNLD